ncbi:MAG: RNA-binding protein, partial [Phycisphaerales bacterium]|nr:RNA-binding protein [Phycisphaerales bacterium]
MNLYVGNLPYSMNDQELNDLFSEIGDVQSARVMSDRETGRSRGFGFVEMADNDAGHEAIEKLNGNDIDGRALVVNEARPREERPRGGGFGGGGGGGRSGGGYGGGSGGGGGS